MYVGFEVLNKIEAYTFRIKFCSFWKVSCPICREKLTQTKLDLINLDKQNLIVYDDGEPNDIVISKKTRDLQKKMEILFNKQKVKGGIIEIVKDEIIVLTVCFFLMFQSDLKVFENSNQDSEKFLEQKLSLTLQNTDCL